jgi:phospholipase D1/2
VLTRVVPVAPFTVVNLVAGASHIRWRDFAVGTVLGMAPGIFVITLFTARVRAMLTHPTLGNAAILTGTSAGIALVAYVLVRWLMRRAGE